MPRATTAKASACTVTSHFFAMTRSEEVVTEYVKRTQSQLMARNGSLWPRACWQSHVHFLVHAPLPCVPRRGAKPPHSPGAHCETKNSDTPRQVEVTTCGHLPQAVRIFL